MRKVVTDSFDAKRWSVGWTLSSPQFKERDKAPDRKGRTPEQVARRKRDAGVWLAALGID